MTTDTKDLAMIYGGIIVGAVAFVGFCCIIGWVIQWVAS